MNTTDAVVGPDEGATPRTRSSTSGVLHWIQLVLGTLAISLLMKLFVFQAFSIPSESMLPTLEVGDRIVVEKLSYRFGEIERGDVVVFRPPVDAEFHPSIRHLVKRVVAVGGDTVEARDGRLYVNGELSPEPYVQESGVTDGLPVQEVPAGELFVLGDNRQFSGDSRVFGTVPEDLVEGQAVVKFWPTPEQV